MKPLLEPAQYLLRIDDLCPTVHRESWTRIHALISEFRIRPILAVVPDNQDPELRQSPANPEFWTEMRALESAGATVAIHGYRHICSSRGKSLIPLHRYTEFAGLPHELQRMRLSKGLQILRSKGLHPRLWVAPRHGFDSNTVSALRDEGIGFISDGLARTAFLREGVMWIPQQVWGPVAKQKGLWTICLHPDTPTAARLGELRVFLEQHAAQFTSFQRVAAEFAPVPLHAGERIYETAATWRLRLRRYRKQVLASHRQAAPPA